MLLSAQKNTLKPKASTFTRHENKEEHRMKEEKKEESCSRNSSGSYDNLKMTATLMLILFSDKHINK